MLRIITDKQITLLYLPLSVRQKLKSTLAIFASEFKDYLPNKITTDQHFVYHKPWDILCWHVLSFSLLDIPNDGVDIGNSDSPAWLVTLFYHSQL